MKLLFSILFSLFTLVNFDISEIRKLYPNVASSEVNAKDFAAKLADVSNDDTKALVAYKGASITISSKYIKKISEKIKIFKEGVKLLEYAVANEPNNIEIRLIRLSVQENVPKIIGYNKNKKEDVAFILAHYKEQTKPLATYIKSFILQSKSFSTQEKLSI
jgi:aspartyl-tRNA synthetase